MFGFVKSIRGRFRTDDTVEVISGVRRGMTGVVQESYYEPIVDQFVYKVKYEWNQFRDNCIPVVSLEAYTWERHNELQLVRRGSLLKRIKRFRDDLILQGVFTIFGARAFMLAVEEQAALYYAIAGLYSVCLFVNAMQLYRRISWGK